MASMKFLSRLPSSVSPVVLAVSLLGLLNGVGWALLTPTFQVPDETAHFAYVQYLAETGKRPGDVGRPEYSSEQTQVMGALRTTIVIGRALEKGPQTEAQDRQADQAISDAQQSASRKDAGGPSTASGQPSLYYALAAVPYRLTSWASLPTRVVAVRLFGALLLGLTAGLVALLASSLLPGRTWPAFVAGAAVGLQPVVGFVSAGATPDPLLMFLSTALIYLVTRSISAGLTQRRAVLLGSVIGAGTVTKLTFLALLPPTAAIVLFLVVRDRSRFRTASGPDWAGGVKALSVVLGSALVLPLVFVIWTKIQGMAIRPPGTAPALLPAAQQNLGTGREELSYIWQLYLPKAPGQIDQFGFSPITETWIKGFVGRYGWLDYSAPTWMVDAARQIIVVGLGLATLSVFRYRKRVRQHLPEGLAMLAILASLLVVIGHEGYGFRNSTNLVFEQARYVFPVVALYALGVVAACAAAGRRAAPLVAFGCVGLFAAHSLSGVFLTLDRYYG